MFPVFLDLKSLMKTRRSHVHASGDNVKATIRKQHKGAVMPTYLRHLMHDIMLIALGKIDSLIRSLKY